MTPDRSHSDTVGHVNKVRVEGGFAHFNIYFYFPKYYSSDALPAPEIFLISISLQEPNELYLVILMNSQIFPIEKNIHICEEADAEVYMWTGVDGHIIS